MTIQETYAAAVAHVQAGRLAEAEQLLRQLLAQAPHHADALQLLAVIAFHNRRLDVAIDYLQQAVRANPAHFEGHSNLSALFGELERWPEAIAHAQQAVTLNPNFPDAYKNLGNALRGSSQLAAAEAAYRQAVALRPNFPSALLQLGLTLKAQNRLPESSDAYRQALAMQPNFPEAHVNLAVTLLQMEQPEQALAHLRQAIALRPNFPEAHLNLAVVLRKLNQPQEALAACRNALALRQDFGDALSTLAAISKDLGQLQQAADACRQVTRLRPQSADAHNALGIALNDLNLIDEAIAAYRQAIAIDPNHIGALNNLGLALKDAGQLDEALSVYRRARDLALTRNDPRAKDLHSNICYTIHFHPDYTPTQVLVEHRDWNVRYAAPLASFTQSHPNDRSANRRLRIGYISPDFRSHVIGFNLLPLFRNHNHEQFEIFCYSDVRVPDDYTRRFQATADHWHDIADLSDERVADLVHRDQIDILVDLALHMAGNRLLVFARKPAPVQITFAGYPATTGLDAIDYRLTDPYLDPPDGSTDSHHSEKNLRLAHSFWCYDPIDTTPPPINSLPALTAGHMTFGCFNNFCKINDRVLDLWATVLRALPTSRLHVLAPRTSHRNHLLQQLESNGIAPTRVELLDYRPRLAYLQLYNRVDLCLDTFPYNGHTTSLDGLFMGVPTITLVGQTTVSRAGFSQLSNLNLAELAARTPAEFLQIATALANDLPRLSALRQSLRQRMQSSPLMNPKLFATSIESAYRQALHTHCNSPR